MRFITQWLVSLTAEHIGTDGFGNRYYESRKPDSESRGLGRRRRFVLYRGQAEASKVPPEWHGWLHHTEENPPPAGGYVRLHWQKDHLPNLTGTIHAHKPPGHLSRGGTRPPATGDYQAWKPE